LVRCNSAKTGEGEEQLRVAGTVLHDSHHHGRVSELTVCPGSALYISIWRWLLPRPGHPGWYTQATCAQALLTSWHPGDSGSRRDLEEVLLGLTPPAFSLKPQLIRANASYSTADFKDKTYEILIETHVDKSLRAAYTKKRRKKAKYCQCWLTQIT
jgi:hypothetical protein